MGIHFLVTQVVSLVVMGLYLLLGGDPMSSTLLVLGMANLVIVPIGIWLMRYDDRLRQYPGHIWQISGRDAGITFLLGICYGQVFNTLLGLLNLFEIFSSYQDMMGSVLADQSFFLQLLVLGLAAPVAEELIFRGLIYRRLKDYVRPGLAMVLSALIFGIYHGNMLQFIYATLLGMIFVLLMERSGSLWGSILAHIGANSWSVVLSTYGVQILEGRGAILLSVVLLALFLGSIFGILYLKKTKSS